MAHLILKEIDQEPFNVDQLIENLTYKSTDGRVGSSTFDPLILEDIFKRTIEDLKKLNEKSKSRLEALGNDCTKEKEMCRERIVNLERHYKDSYDHLSTLDKRISYVSTTMAEMGNQLENLNRPRLNLYESHKTAKYFDKFMDGIDNSGVFADDSKLDQAAEVIYKLHLVAQDLKDEKFAEARVLIDNKYVEIENKLIQMFHQAYFTGDRKEMKKYLNILSNFKSYQECINEFIKNIQSPLLSSKDIFADVLPLCKDANLIINEVLPNNERIMQQFIRDLFLGKVQSFVNSNIEKYKEVDSEKYLDTIYLYYNKNMKIFKEISKILKISSESSFFSKLITDVYSVHLKDYVHLEKFNLQNKLKLHLERFYDSLGHVKRQLQTGFVSNLLSKQTNELIDERFLSHDVTTLCIDDAKKAINRILVLCETNFQPKVIEELYDIICYFLCKEHFYYAMDLNINALQSVDFKQDINLAVFPLIKQQNDLMYLFETFSQQTVFVALSSTASQTKLKNKLKQICTELETRIDAALEKGFTVICNHIKYVFQVEQKKIDFKPETDEMSNKCTPACAKAIKIIENQIGKINSCLDGRNINSALKELGIKFHRCIYDHLFRFEYNEMGAMALIRDINEYRLCAKNFNNPIVDKLFTVLYSLCNLLVVKASNLQEICAGENLANLSKETIEGFVQLRSDYKTLKLQIVRPK